MIGLPPKSRGAEPVRAPSFAAANVPFWLPASHFAIGLLFLTTAGLLLPFAAADLAAGRFLQPRVVAVVHLITLGWLTTSIMGALCQLFGVVLGTPLRSVRLATATLLLFVPGLGLFVCALFTGETRLVVPGALSLAGGLVLFIINAAATLRRSTQRDLTWWALAVALGFLLATIAFGISLGVNLKSGHLAEGRMMALAVHVHVALAGWVGLVIMGVARRLLPMFLLSHGAGERSVRVAIVATASGAGLLSLFHRAMNDVVFTVAVILLAAGAVALAVQIAGYVRKRHRPQLDAGLRLLLTGSAFVLAAVAAGLINVTVGAAPARVTAYGIMLIGGLALFVAGHYYKILPFLLWNHRYAPRVGKQPLPKIAELFSARVATVAGALSAAGLAALALGAGASTFSLTLAGALLVCAGFTTEAVQLLILLRTKPV
jgi:hypothetical protein